MFETPISKRKEREKELCFCCLCVPECMYINIHVPFDMTLEYMIEKTARRERSNGRLAIINERLSAHVLLVAVIHAKNLILFEFKHLGAL